LRRDGPAFHDHNIIANLAAQFIVGLHLMMSVDHFLIKRVPEGAADLDHNGLLHFIADHYTSHPSSFVHFFSPS
jgi:hypothetical protein